MLFQPVGILYIKYCSIRLFLFCPAVVGIQVYVFFTQTVVFNKEMNPTYHSIDPLPVSPLSSEMKWIFLRITSQLIPNNEHFLVGRKRIRPGGSGFNKEMNPTYHSIDPLPVSSLSSEMKLIFLRITSQLIPNNEHFLVGRKRIRPGGSGSEGKCACCAL